MTHTSSAGALTALYGTLSGQTNGTTDMMDEMKRMTPRCPRRACCAQKKAAENKQNLPRQLRGTISCTELNEL